VLVPSLTARGDLRRAVLVRHGVKVTNRFEPEPLKTMLLSPDQRRDGRGDTQGKIRRGRFDVANGERQWSRDSVLIDGLSGNEGDRGGLFTFGPVSSTLLNSAGAEVLLSWEAQARPA